jgi:hypothetical protein
MTWKEGSGRNNLKTEGESEEKNKSRNHRRDLPRGSQSEIPPKWPSDGNPRKV